MCNLNLISRNVEIDVPTRKNLKGNFMFVTRFLKNKLKKILYIYFSVRSNG